jgi:Hypoxia induced protein conserved region
MPSLPSFAVAVALFAVTLVLALGLINLLRAGPGNRSQQLMRWRVGLQFIAILLIAAVLFFRARQG